MSAPYATHRAQIAAILTAWGMPPEPAARTAEILGWADLHGVDSHGMSMLTQYDGWRREGRLDLAATPRIARESPVSALVEGGGGLGHVPADFAMRLAVAKARKVGMAAVSVRDSSHFGACGYYGLIAAEAGLIGIVTTTAAGVRVAPTFGAQAKLGTDPWCFAAPGEPGRPFLLDMATTTVAFGRVRNKANEGLAAPPGWVLTPEGGPSTDPADVTERAGFLTSLGGSAENASYKGYGLAMMVDILAGGLAGMSFPSDPDHTRRLPGIGLGHFFLAMNPEIFRDSGDFRADVARFCGQMRATTPIDPARPVLVAGDAERAIAARRLAEGVPVGAGLAARIRAIAEAAGAPWLLG
ncbi:MAG: Ldh family oxidoreductase [Rhodospirillales bacterium]|nr:Ldh family oxidoreductase [Rhodospirillales bacterium]